MFFDAFWKSANLIKKMKRNHANVANGILYNSSIENDWETKETRKIKNKQIANNLVKKAISLFMA